MEGRWKEEAREEVKEGGRKEESLVEALTFKRYWSNTIGYSALDCPD